MNVLSVSVACLELESDEHNCGVCYCRYSYIVNIGEVNAVSNSDFCVLGSRFISKDFSSSIVSFYRESEYIFDLFTWLLSCFCSYLYRQWNQRLYTRELLQGVTFQTGIQVYCQFFRLYDIFSPVFTLFIIAAEITNPKKVIPAPIKHTIG